MMPSSKIHNILDERCDSRRDLAGQLPTRRKTSASWKKNCLIENEADRIFSVPARPSKSQSRGFVLIMVLVVVMLASMVVASLLFLMRSEKTATAAGLAGEQAWATAMSGVYQAMRIASQSGVSREWEDNAALFKNQMVVDDGANQWYFSVYSVGDFNSPEIRFGLADEAGKINITSADIGTLERLPNLAPPLAQILVDFAQGRNDFQMLPAETNAATPIELSAEPSTNGPLSFTLSPSPRRLSCLDELLHLPGFPSSLVYGEDANLNGNLDPNEDDGDASIPPDNQDAQLDLGLRPLLTVLSYDLNLDNTGQPRLNLNDSTNDLSALDVPESVKAYIEAMRRNGKIIAHPADLLEASGQFKDEKGFKTNLVSGVGKTELPILLDRCTGTNENRLVGLVNLNTASAKALAALPGSDASLAEAIVAARVGLSDDARRTPAWLYQEGLVNADLFKKMAPHLTTRSYQFHFHVFAYAVPAGTYRVVEAVIDTAIQPPAILLLRDLTRLGMPYGITPLKEPVRENTATGLAPKASPLPIAKNLNGSKLKGIGKTTPPRIQSERFGSQGQIRQPMPPRTAQSRGSLSRGARAEQTVDWCALQFA